MQPAQSVCYLYVYVFRLDPLVLDNQFVLETSLAWENIFLLLAFFSFLQFTVGLSSHELCAMHASTLLLSSLFSSCLGSRVGETSRAELLTFLGDTTSQQTP